MRCPQCGNINLEPASSCQVCGAALTLPDPDRLSPEPATASASTDQPLTSVLYQALVGPLHTDYYLQHFARFDAAGKARLSWHWPAFFATLGWLIFRRLWVQALIFVALSVALALTLFGVLPLLVDVSQEMLWGIAAPFLLAECVLPALWANALYYQHCNRVLTLALQASPDISATQARLTALSSSRARAWVVSALTLALWLSVATLGAWLAWGGPAGLGLRPLAFAPARSASTPRPASGASAALAAAASGVQMPAASAAPALPASTAVSEAAALTAAAPPASAPTGAEVSVSTVPTASASLASAPVPATVAKPAAVAVPSAQRQPPARPKAAASASSASNKTGKFVVAVGQFAQEQNANKAYEKLEAAGLPVHSNNVDGPDGTLLLIRVGPFAHLAEARQAAQQIRALGLPAVVMRR